MKNLTLITGNLNKVVEFERLLGFEFGHQEIDLPEIQTTDVREVVRHKARLAYEKLGRPVLVDDSGFTIEAWGELPGAFIRWFLDNVGSDGIIKML
ncbi:MAG: non-canonical purine NTP pyrophosphatase, partial [Candidatus Nomurabacteria bacterium]|nr:non-canonical purine NTP pyrophosphatase [Candidatus Nomurabacteria bacterium]